MDSLPLSENLALLHFLIGQRFIIRNTDQSENEEGSRIEGGRGLSLLLLFVWKFFPPIINGAIDRELKI